MPTTSPGPYQPNSGFPDLKTPPSPSLTVTMYDRACAIQNPNKEQIADDLAIYCPNLSTRTRLGQSQSDMTLMTERVKQQRRYSAEGMKLASQYTAAIFNTVLGSEGNGIQFTIDDWYRRKLEKLITEEESGIEKQDIMNLDETTDDLNLAFLSLLGRTNWMSVYPEFLTQVLVTGMSCLLMDTKINGSIEFSIVPVLQVFTGDSSGTSEPSVFITQHLSKEVLLRHIQMNRSNKMYNYNDVYISEIHRALQGGQETQTNLDEIIFSQWPVIGENGETRYWWTAVDKRSGNWIYQSKKTSMVQRAILVRTRANNANPHGYGFIGDMNRQNMKWLSGLTEDSATWLSLLINPPLTYDKDDPDGAFIAAPSLGPGDRIAAAPGTIQPVLPPIDPSAIFAQKREIAQFNDEDIIQSRNISKSHQSGTATQQIIAEVNKKLLPIMHELKDCVHKPFFNAIKFALLEMPGNGALKSGLNIAAKKGISKAAKLELYNSLDNCSIVTFPSFTTLVSTVGQHQQMQAFDETLSRPVAPGTILSVVRGAEGQKKYVKEALRVFPAGRRGIDTDYEDLIDSAFSQDDQQQPSPGAEQEQVAAGAKLALG